LTDRAIHRVKASFVASLPRFCTRYPRLPIRPLLADLELAPDQLSDPGIWLDVARGVALLEGAARRTNDAAFALRFAEQMPWADIRVIAGVVRNAPTIGDALAAAARYFALQSTGAGLVLTTTGSEAHLVYTIFDPTVALHPQNTELVFGLLVRAVRDALGEPGWRPRALIVRHDRPARAHVQDNYFGCSIEYAGDADALVVTAEDMMRPLARADLSLLPDLVENANRDLAAIDGDALGPLRAVVGDLLRDGEGTPSIASVARRARTSARSLQRQLTRHGYTFTDLVADARRTLAEHYMRDPDRSLTDVALALGYSELSAFSRAFRRWSGTSALAFRAALSSSQAERAR
jgi:AraC-like DNA-binding protein